MNCYFHPDRIAVAQCCDCGTGLCEDCAAKYSPPKCDSCQGQRYTTAQKSEIGVVLAKVILGCIIGAVMCFAMMDTFRKRGDDQPLFIATVFAFFAGIPCGWGRFKRLNLSTMLTFLLSLLGGWVFMLYDMFILIVYVFTNKKTK